MKSLIFMVILYLLMHCCSVVSAVSNVPSINFKRFSSDTGASTLLLTLLPTSNVQRILSEGLTSCGEDCYLNSFYDLTYASMPVKTVSGQGIHVQMKDKPQFCIPHHLTIGRAIYDCKIKTDIVYSAPLYVGKLNTYYFGSSDGLFFAYHIPDVLYYHLNLGGDLSHSRPVADHQGVLYENSDNGYIYAINTDGTLKWQTLVAPQGIKKNVVLGQAAKLYGTSMDGQVFALNAVNGIVIWRQPYHAVTVPAIGFDGTVYIGDAFNNLVAIQTSASGMPNVKWKVNVQGQIRYTPVVDANGVVYEPSGDEHLWAINADGSKKWAHPFAYPITARVTIDTATGHIYVPLRYGVGALSLSGNLLWNTTPSVLLVDNQAGPVTLTQDGSLLIPELKVTTALQSPNKFQYISLGPTRGVYYGHLWFTTAATGGSGQYEYTLNISSLDTKVIPIKGSTLDYNVLNMTPNKTYIFSLFTKDKVTDISVVSKDYKIKWP